MTDYKLKPVTLLFLQKEDQLLLAMKKRGFGVGLWNGVGGKVDARETIEDAVIRECQEEIRVTPLRFRKVAALNFHFPPEKAALDWDLQAHVYLCDQWKGSPEETEEMRPQWFSVSEIPYGQMWADDIHWLPLILEGRQLTAVFHFDDHDKLKTFEIKEVPVL